MMGKLSDLNAKKDLESLSSMIREGITTDLTLFTKIYIDTIDNKDIIVIEVEEGVNKPYYLTDKGMKPSGVFLRYGNTTIKASDEIIRKMITETKSSSFEIRTSENQNLHFEYLINEFLKKEYQGQEQILYY